MPLPLNEQRNGVSRFQRDECFPQVVDGVDILPVDAVDQIAWPEIACWRIGLSPGR